MYFAIAEQRLQEQLQGAVGGPGSTAPHSLGAAAAVAAGMNPMAGLVGMEPAAGGEPIFPVAAPPVTAPSDVAQPLPEAADDPVPVQSREELAALPPGTKFVLPDGRTGTRQRPLPASVSQ